MNFFSIIPEVCVENLTGYIFLAQRLETVRDTVTVLMFTFFVTFSILAECNHLAVEDDVGHRDKKLSYR